MTRPTDIAAIVLAAGAGTRMGDGDPTPKQFRDVRGEPMVRHSVRTLRRWGCRSIVVAAPRGGTDAARAALGDEATGVVIVEGSDSRAASTRAALAAVDVDRVLVHDAARPHASVELLNRLAAALDDVDGVIPALAVTDTVKLVADGRIVDTLPRGEVGLAQTPQLFKTDVLRTAHEAAMQADREFTDDASIVEAFGRTVRVVEGDPANRKITTSADLSGDAAIRPRAGPSAPDVRVGHGYDTHRTTTGSSIMLCGIEIPAPFALDGHSDADIGLHALVDALLGTCGEGDIGSHFPPSDERWRGAASDRFLAHANDVVRARGGRITCADVTVICEVPKVGPHREPMRERIAGILDIDIGRVSVKATTNERVGFIGRNEGLAALATATVIYD